MAMESITFRTEAGNFWGESPTSAGNAAPRFSATTQPNTQVVASFSSSHPAASTDASCSRKMGVAMTVETIGPGKCPDCGGPASIAKDHTGKIVRVSCLKCSNNVKRQPKEKGDGKRKPAASEHLAELFDLTLATGDAELFHTPSGDPLRPSRSATTTRPTGWRRRRSSAGSLAASTPPTAPHPEPGGQGQCGCARGPCALRRPRAGGPYTPRGAQRAHLPGPRRCLMGVIEVTQTGWRRVQKPPVKFRRPKGDASTARACAGRHPR